MLNGEPFPRASESGLRLVDNQQGPMVLRQFLQELQIPTRWNQHSPRRQQRFDNHGGNVAPIADPALKRLQARKIAAPLRGAGKTSRALRRDWQPEALGYTWKGIMQMMRKKAGAALGGQRGSVITARETYDTRSSGIGFGQTKCEFIGFGAGR